jgi:hypothetical protein
MGREFKPAPFKEQDKLKEKLIKTEEGSYIKLSTAFYTFKGGEEFIDSKQDKLKEGLIRLTNGSYHPFDSIEKVEESDCFVATAVYGNANAPQVEALREFRDNVLMQSKVGKAFVNFYYGGAGEKTANFIREHLPSAISPIKKGLDRLVERYSSEGK